jgi:dTDP-4-dehydrorhamnose reductase
LATVCLEVLSYSKQLNTKGNVYHYSNEGVASWYDFATAIMDLDGLSCKVKPIETKDYPTAARRPHFSVLNKTKIKNDFEIEIPYWRTSLARCISKLKQE